MSIKKIIDTIIPPSDYQYRNGFNNIPTIEKLTSDEKLQVEDYLINMLSDSKTKSVDTLIVETLAYLKSKKSLPVLRSLFDYCNYEMCKLIIAASIYEICEDKSMIDIAISSFRKMDDKSNSYYKYNLISGFSYLVKFQNPEINKIIEEYLDHQDSLVSYNAKESLGYL